MAAEAPQGKETASGAEQGRRTSSGPIRLSQGAQADEKTEPKNEPDNARNGLKGGADPGRQKAIQQAGWNVFPAELLRHGCAQLGLRVRHRAGAGATGPRAANVRSTGPGGRWPRWPRAYAEPPCFARGPSGARGGAGGDLHRRLGRDRPPGSRDHAMLDRVKPDDQPIVGPRSRYDRRPAGRAVLRARASATS